MKPGGQVIYTDPRGERHAATVTAVVDTGKSGNKVLDLSFDGGKGVVVEAKGVPHEVDRDGAGACWALPAETNPLPAAKPAKSKKRK